MGIFRNNRLRSKMQIRFLATGSVSVLLPVGLKGKISPSHLLVLSLMVLLHIFPLGPGYQAYGPPRASMWPAKKF